MIRSACNSDTERTVTIRNASMWCEWTVLCIWLGMGVERQGCSLSGLRANSSVILPVVSCAWSFVCHTKGRIWTQKRVMRIFWPNGDGENCITRSFINCTLHQNRKGCWNRGGQDGRELWHAWEERSVYKILDSKLWREERAWET
jgi:hypothetical protein